MTFDQVLPALKEGRKARMRSWVNIKYVELHDGFLRGIYENLQDQRIGVLALNYILADDWEIVE